MEIDSNELKVINNEEASRFEVRFGDLVAFAAYKLSNNIITFTHTIVPIELEGQGIGRKLAETGLGYAHEHNLKVIPQCPFISGFIRKNPQYQPLTLGYTPPE